MWSAACWSLQRCVNMALPLRQRLDFVAVLGCFSGVHLFATPWTVAHQVPLSMGYSSKNTGVSCHALLQGSFPTQGLNPHLLSLLHWQADSLPLHHLGSPLKKMYYHKKKILNTV